MGSIQSALLGFGAFKALQQCGLGRNFSVEENVIVQTTSVAVAMIPLTAGLVSIVPALGMLTKEDNPPDGPFDLSFTELVLWTLAVAYFGAFAAVPLRTQTILREKLKFPSGSATAKVIQLLHQSEKGPVYYRLEDEESNKDSGEVEEDIEEGTLDLPAPMSCSLEIENPPYDAASRPLDLDPPGDWQRSLLILAITFGISFVYKIFAELVEVDDDQIFATFPVFSWLGWEAASRWGWVLYPSPGYIGQGMIMGPRTCLSMLAGAIVGFVVLGPVAREQGWAPGSIDNLEDGAAGASCLSGCCLEC